MSNVQLREIEHFYGQTRVLQGMNLCLESGDYVVLLGESGCGKTTTLQAIAGLKKPAAGSVWIADRDVTDVPPRHRDVSMVFQHDALYPHWTVRDSMAFALRKTLSPNELASRIGQAAELAGATKLLDRYPDKLSGGELRRAAIAKAVVRQAGVRLMDEPLSALDASLRHELQEDLLRWHHAVEGTTLHVTHDGQEAMRMADKIAVMDAGQIVQYAPPMEIYRKPANRSVARAVGWPPINLVTTSQLGEDQLRGCCGFQMDVASEAEIGVRADAMNLLAADQAIDQPGIAFHGQVTRLSHADGALHVRATVGPSTVSAMVPTGQSPPTVGQQYQLFAAADQLHLFDVRSGKRIDVESDR